tara:strand:- start:719 stop:937 length:219 start_codon:yes stop_codon:yes gene_type:complete
MEKLGKLLEFIKENRMLERYNRRTGEWEQVEIDLSDPEILETLMVMSAEMTIEIKRNKMRFGLDKLKPEEKN